MRTLAHLSDLHFGTEDPDLVEGLGRALRDVRPDVIAISGDLTQRARRDQFRHARAFLDTLAAPVVVVPGNHDVPLYDVASRFLDPLRRYRTFIGADLEPTFADAEIAVFGLNTTRSLTIKDGALRATHVVRLASRLRQLGEAIVKVVVAHHPFDPPEGRVSRVTLRAEGRRHMAALVEAGADVFLTGHLHVAYLGHSATRYRVSGRTAIVVEAGTATSTRLRHESNSFNVLRMDGPRLAIARVSWIGALREFQPAAGIEFTRTAEGWQDVSSL